MSYSWTVIKQPQMHNGRSITGPQSVVTFYVALDFPSSLFLKWSQTKCIKLNRGNNNGRTLVGMAKRWLWLLNRGLISQILFYNCFRTLITSCLIESGQIRRKEPNTMNTNWNAKKVITLLKLSLLLFWLVQKTNFTKSSHSNMHY